MFSGIIEELGTLRRVGICAGGIRRLQIQAQTVREDTKTGDSIAVNGVCLTVVDITGDTLSFEAVPETLRVSNLGKLRCGEKVNLERSLRAGDRICGHFVSGHVDCQGTIRRKIRQSGAAVFEIAVPAQFMKYAVARGSIAVDGISLTIAGKQPGGVRLQIIPHTLKNTTLSFKGPSHTVNLEFDMLLKRDREPPV